MSNQNLEVKIKAFKEAYNTVEDLLSESDYFLYQNTDRQLSTKLVYDALVNKLKEDPAYEVWIPLRYWKYIIYRKQVSKPFVECEHVFISNKGRVCNLNKPGVKIETGRNTDHGYLVFSTKIDGVFTSLIINRAVACCFIPLNEKFLAYKLTELETNHLDGDKHNNDFLNIEWCTGEHNNNHAHLNELRIYKTAADHPLTKSLVGTVVDNKKFEGTQFLIHGRTECEKYRMGKAEEVALGKRSVRNGCQFRLAIQGDEGLPHISELPTELLEWFVVPRVVVYVGTNIDTGEEIRLSGREDVEKAGFGYSKVSNAANGKIKSYKGFTFTKE